MLVGTLGSIGVGKLADLMVINGNPLENTRNTANIESVRSPD